MTTDLDDLRRKAEAATRGLWVADLTSEGMNGRNYYRVWSRNKPTTMIFRAGQIHDADAAYIAAASPDVVLELLNRIADVEAALRARADRETERE